MQYFSSIAVKQRLKTSEFTQLNHFLTLYASYIYAFMIGNIAFLLFLLNQWAFFTKKPVFYALKKVYFLLKGDARTSKKGAKLPLAR